MLLSCPTWIPGHVLHPGPLLSEVHLLTTALLPRITAEPAEPSTRQFVSVAPSEAITPPPLSLRATPSASRPSPTEMPNPPQFRMVPFRTVRPFRLPLR